MVNYEKELGMFAMLSENNRRCYAGIEALKLGHGGIGYVSKLFEIDPKTVQRGLAELEQTDAIELNRIRKKRWESQKCD